MTQNAKTTPQRPNCGTEQSFEVCGEFVLRLTIGQWCRRCGTNLCGKEFGLTWILGIVCLRTESTHWNVPNPTF